MTMSGEAPTNSCYPTWIVLPSTTTCVYIEIHFHLQKSKIFGNPYHSIKEGCLFCFVLFVMVRSPGPCVPRLSVWYRRKALSKEGCTGLVS